jgi:YfiR/HmsC-like
VLNQAVADQRVSNRPIEIKRISTVGRNSGCQILFDAGSPEQSIAAALAAVQGTPVLTVTDSEDYGGPKGIINFVIRENHVRFEINDAAAAENGLVISSKLLSLAVAVTPRTEMEIGTTAA